MLLAHQMQSSKMSELKLTVADRSAEIARAAAEGAARPILEYANNGDRVAGEGNQQCPIIANKCTGTAGSGCQREKVET